MTCRNPAVGARLARVFPGAQAAERQVHGHAAPRIDRGGLNGHGFLSTFRAWCAEGTAHPREVAEQALAHALPDKVEAAYRRGNMLEKRRRRHCQVAGLWPD